MRIEGGAALVTGANRGLGAASPGRWSSAAREPSTPAAGTGPARAEARRARAAQAGWTRVLRQSA